MPDDQNLRIAAISDLHYDRHAGGSHVALFDQINEAADVFLICGDLTDYGLEEEAELLAQDLSSVDIPILAVLGNHDFESGTPEQVHDVMEEAGVRMLDGESITIDGVGFAGVNGFAGGFGKWMLTPWGEPVYKAFVDASVREALKLEEALSRLDTPERIVLMHYAPIRETVEGEPPEIFPFLGSSRLEEPLNRYKVRAAFHGHAHKGTAKGVTSEGVDVYNVSIPVLKKTYPDQPTYRLIEVPRETNVEESVQTKNGRPDL